VIGYKRGGNGGNLGCLDPRREEAPCLGSLAAPWPGRGGSEGILSRPGDELVVKASGGEKMAVPSRKSRRARPVLKACGGSESGDGNGNEGPALWPSVKFGLSLCERRGVVKRERVFIPGTSSIRPSPSSGCP